MTNRREFLGVTVGTALLGSGLLNGTTPGQCQPPARDIHAELMQGWQGNEAIAMVLYDGFTLLDFFGPHHMFLLMSGAKLHLVSASLEPLKSEGGIEIRPTMTFDECPQELDVLFVPGGTEGTLKAMEDRRTLDFLADRAEHTKWISSVCTGSLLLAAAGLLDGYRATSHWLARPALSQFGSTPVDERVVIDRNRITGAGVTAGMDLGLTLVGKLRGDTFAQAAQLFAEYDPRPPYHSGSCLTAPPEIVTLLREMHTPFTDKVAAIAAKKQQSSAKTDPQ
ncbi:MAG: DJ-1/PfpI family protein [Pirellulales bacterium]